MVKRLITITEYQSLIDHKGDEGYAWLSKSLFDQLEKFVLTYKSKSADALELLTLGAKKGLGKTITAKNYVGIITMKDGTTIEILPKIYSSSDKDNDARERTKKLLLDMIKALRSTPYKSLQTSSVDTKKMDIFEIFIRMFVNEVTVIAKKGLKCDYESIDENVKTFKGKLLVAKHLKYNLVHKEQFYVRYDRYDVNRPENRLIKSTLKYLYTISHSGKNKMDIKVLLNFFENVPASVDHNKDYGKVSQDRNMDDYRTALFWCNVFLSGKSFTSFAGSDVAIALLFPMDKLFESYIASKFYKALDREEYSVTTQDRTYHLFNNPNKFSLRPDIVITHNKGAGKEVFVMDTKWKMLNTNASNFGISQGDMYQMYAYQKKYGAANITLIYPLTDCVKQDEPIQYTSNDGVTINVKFVDLFDVDDSIKNILSGTSNRDIQQNYQN